MSYLLCILLLFLSCKEQEYSDYSPLAPSDCEYEDITGAVQNYVSDVKSSSFPNKNEQY